VSDYTGRIKAIEIKPSTAYDKVVLLANVADIEVATLTKELEALRTKVSELEGDGNTTAAEILREWWSAANIQGEASMHGDEMIELTDAMEASNPSAQQGET
jgi:hypothetical protein